MPTFAGHKSQIQISTAGAGGPFNAIPKLRSLSFPRNSEDIDASNNDSGGWTESLNGRKSWSVSGEYLLLSEDNAVQDALYDAWVNDSEIYVRILPIVESGTRYFEGLVVVGQLDLDEGQSDPAVVSFELRPRGPLTKATQA